MNNYECPYCGKIFIKNFYNVKPHIENCEKNPKNNFTEEPQLYVSGKFFLKSQKIKYICANCKKEHILVFARFVLPSRR